MWNRMKKWLHHLLQEDPSHEDELDDSSQSIGGNKPKNEFQTKMVYQYPKQGEFRFPVIPDEKKGMKRTRSYESNQNQEAKQQYTERDTYPTYTRKEQRNSVNRSYNDSTNESSNNTKHQRDKKDVPYPFVPSDVPSPIYGFGSRNEEEGNAINLEDIPAFLRQQNETTSEDYKTTESSLHDTNREDTHEDSSEEVEDEKPKDGMSDHIIPFFDLPVSERDGQNEVQEEASEETPEEEDPSLYTPLEEEQEEKKSFFKDFEPDEQTQEPITTYQQVTPEIDLNKSEHIAVDQGEADMEDTIPEGNIEMDSPSEEALEKAEDQNQPQVKQTEDQRPAERSRRPFNVIMTPRDKRNRDRKENQPEKKVTEHSIPVEASEEEVDSGGTEEQLFTEEIKESRPPLHLLDDPIERDENDDTWVKEQMQLLETTLQHFHVKAKVVNAMKGPAVTRFEVQPEPGVKVSKITNLADDIKLSLAAKDIRMEAPIPGKNAIGIEVPNQQAQAVSLQEILESSSFKENDSPLSVGLGLDIAGSPVITDLKKMPHGLIAGATGSGKSVSINTILISLLYKAHHKDVKFLLIDPKMVELAPYNDLPHLVAPVITDVKAATSALKWAVKEMEERYEKFVAEGVRDIDRYNEKMKEKGRIDEKMPYMVIVIDELADLMMVSPQDVEDAICRIAQKARACGMHLLLATQRPSVDVITGLIKANIPTRVAFSVSSQVDSRTIIDTSGAEKLLGKGDMLFLENGSGKGQRIQGAFVSDDEIERIANYVKKTAPPNYMFEQEELLKQTNFEEEEDDLFEEVVDFVINQNGASASLIQRRFKVGYNRAARLIDTMEEKGIISASKGSKPREVYMTHANFEEYLAKNKE